MGIKDKVKEKFYQPVANLWYYVIAALTMAALALLVAVVK